MTYALDWVAFGFGDFLGWFLLAENFFFSVRINANGLLNDADDKVAIFWLDLAIIFDEARKLFVPRTAKLVHGCKIGGTNDVVDCIDECFAFFEAAGFKDVNDGLVEDFA